MKYIQVGILKAKVDDEDFARVSKLKWHPQEKMPGEYYAFHSHPMRHFSMQEFLMGKVKKGFEIDHIDGDCLNNQKANLRVCTHQENCRNRRKTQMDCSSKYKGVSFYKDRGNWVAYIYDDVKIFLGYFSDEKSAARAYNRAAKRYHGEFARLNKIER